MARADRTPGIRPRVTLARRLDLAARHGFPATLTLLLMMTTKFQFNLPGQAALPAAVTFGSVWFWSVHRPASVPPPVVFVLGVLLDLLGALPLGVGAVSALIMHGVAIRMRQWLSQQDHLVVWLTYVVAVSVVGGLMWMLTALLMLRLLPVGPLTFQAALNAALYPLLAILLLYAHRLVGDTDR